MAVASDDESTINGIRECPICKVDRKVVSIEKLPDKKQFTLECGHPYGEIVMVIPESLNISEGKMIWTSDKDPVAGIRKALEINDYSKALGLACTVFENYGNEILTWYMKRNPKKTVIIPVWDIKKRKDHNITLTTPENELNLKLHLVIDGLAVCEIVSDDDATKMHCIRQLRNNFLHGDSALKLTSEIAERVDARTDDIINYTITIKRKHDESQRQR